MKCKVLSLCKYVKQYVKTQPIGASPSALGVFNVLLGEEIWNIIALHKNTFASDKQLLHPDPSWPETTPDEMKAYFDICVLISRSTEE